MSLSFLVVTFDITSLVELFSVNLSSVSEMLGIKLWDAQELHGHLVRKVCFWIPTLRNFYSLSLARGGRVAFFTTLQAIVM